MNRVEITKFLGDLLVSKKLSGPGKYWAREVTIDWGTSDVKRIDYLQFAPQSQSDISSIEKGIFTVYEIKSCKADYNSGYGKNFVAEKNYLVMPIGTYKEVGNTIPHGVGAIVPVPEGRDLYEEYRDPTDLSTEIRWDLNIIKSAHAKGRKRPMAELLFCMLRSGH